MHSTNNSTLKPESSLPVSSKPSIKTETKSSHPERFKKSLNVPLMLLKNSTNKLQKNTNDYTFITSIYSQIFLHKCISLNLYLKSHKYLVFLLFFHFYCTFFIFYTISPFVRPLKMCNFLLYSLIYLSDNFLKVLRHFKFNIRFNK